MSAKFLVPIFSAALFTSLVAAQTSLFIPGFDPQPVRASELGTGANGETTWLIAPGVPSGTLSDYEFFGPATVVVGPTAAVINYNDPKLSLNVQESCAISGTIAVCNAAIATGSSTSYTSQITETVSAMPVQPYVQQSPSPSSSSSTSSISSATSPPPTSGSTSNGAAGLGAPAARCAAALFVGVLTGAVTLFL